MDGGEEMVSKDMVEGSTSKEQSNKSGKYKRKRTDGDSPELDNSFSEDERIIMEEAVKKVSEMITVLMSKVANKSVKLKDLVKEVEALGEENQNSLVDGVLPMLAKDNSRKIDFLLEKHYCKKCDIEISREEEEKKMITEKVGEGINMPDKEYSKFLDMNWPQEAYKNTILVTGNVLSFEGNDLIICLENRTEDSNLMGLVKNRFPEVGEVLAEDDDDETEENMPYLENVVKTKKGKTRKRIYFQEISTDKDLKEKMIKFKDGRESGQRSEHFSVAVSTARNRERVRKALEVVFFEETLKINFYVPDSDLQRGGDDSRIRGGRQRSEAVVIDTNVSTYADTLRNIRAVVDLEQLGIEVKTVKATKDKKMVIVTKEGQAEALHKEICAKVTGVETRVTGSKGERYTPLLILDIDASINGKEVEDCIRKTTKVYETHIKSLRIGRSGTQIAVVHMPAKAAEGLIEDGDIKIGWTRCRVKPKIDVLKCFNCLKLGHHSDICREEKGEKKCMNCTQVGHVIRECNNPSFCPMCNKEGHRSDSTFCPSYRMRFQEATDQWHRNFRKETVEEQVIERGEGIMEVEN